MNSDAIFDVIEAIASTSSKNEKLATLKAHAGDEGLKRVLAYAYDPFKVYGMRQLPGLPDNPRGDSSGLHFGDATWTLLDRLCDRTLTGQAAQDAVALEMVNLTPSSRELLGRIIRKDIRAGFSESTINKVWKGLIPEFPYMRCSLPKHVKLETWPWADGVISQEKADGMFANVDLHNDGTVAIRSRQGTEFPLHALTDLVEGIRRAGLRGCQHHGELLVERDGEILDREISNGILNSVASGGALGDGERVLYFVWDAIPLSAVVSKGIYALPYRRRLAAIMQALRDAMRPDGVTPSMRLIPTKVVHSLEAAYEHYRTFLARNKEGTIIKRPDMPWQDGTSKGQVKIKVEFPVDLKATEVVPGRVGTKNEGRPGSLRMVTSCGQLVVDVAVKNEAMRDAIEKNPEDHLERIYEVIANDVMEPSESSDRHSLFLPRMKSPGYRTDKREADDLQQVRDQLEAAKKAA